MSEIVEPYVVLCCGGNTKLNAASPAIMDRFPGESDVASVMYVIDFEGVSAGDMVVFPFKAMVCTPNISCIT